MDARVFYSFFRKSKLLRIIVFFSSIQDTMGEPFLANYENIISYHIWLFLSRYSESISHLMKMSMWFFGSTRFVWSRSYFCFWEKCFSSSSHLCFVPMWSCCFIHEFSGSRSRHSLSSLTHFFISSLSRSYLIQWLSRIWGYTFSISVRYFLRAWLPYRSHLLLLSQRKSPDCSRVCSTMGRSPLQKKKKK